MGQDPRSDLKLKLAYLPITWSICFSLGDRMVSVCERAQFPDHVLAMASQTRISSAKVCVATVSLALNLAFLWTMSTVNHP